MRLSQELRTGDRQATRLWVHALREGQEILELWSHFELWNVQERVEDRESCAGVVDYLMRKEAREVVVICTRTTTSFISVGNPFE